MGTARETRLKGPVSRDRRIHHTVSDPWSNCEAAVGQRSKRTRIECRIVGRILRDGVCQECRKDITENSQTRSQNDVRPKLIPNSSARLPYDARRRREKKG